MLTLRPPISRSHKTQVGTRFRTLVLRDLSDSPINLFTGQAEQLVRFQLYFHRTQIIMNCIFCIFQVFCQRCMHGFTLVLHIWPVVSLPTPLAPFEPLVQWTESPAHVFSKPRFPLFITKCYKYMILIYKKVYYDQIHLNAWEISQQLCIEGGGFEQ
ncbi:uncharacterized protein SPPG_09313 [Spizellomyces punctatus DAOM BR117]|uniref:Uncharacterized protein n=1 Tax=Spizellomyces punctatus (strain DAOM BR117) TaxID=645134 RepID=A0A0L0HD29_SPIPD|nr:uncharacterized protein SPPG_09313 [Spizellomyces punctatus DAOM BR117]KNC98864.1 hypothetical protein SPPG_09313 [Spizellomyces punctatus DAOM BR117]|eukprot:XP_016606904.1 hypothetical protein SPPG_09313 [Spizellomyces punctatus DAOM BR117]